jgi:hypothetical protein
MMSSGPIFTFLIQFEFYPTKRPRFEKKYSPMFFKFHLVFLQKFSRFFIFSKISEFEFQKSTIFKIEPGRSLRISEKSPIFLTLLGGLGFAPVVLLHPFHCCAETLEGLEGDMASSVTQQHSLEV